jgi:hypothetical protein
VPVLGSEKKLTLLFPHGVVGGNVAVFDGPQDVLVVVRPESLVFYYCFHEVFFGESGGLGASVAVVYPKECILQVSFVFCLLISHRKEVLHVFPPALTTVARHTQIHPYRSWHFLGKYIKTTKHNYNDTFGQNLYIRIFDIVCGVTVIVNFNYVKRYDVRTYRVSVAHIIAFTTFTGAYVGD